MKLGLTNKSIMCNISYWFVIVFTLNLVSEPFKYYTAKCVCKRYPPLLTPTLIDIDSVCIAYTFHVLYQLIYTRSPKKHGTLELDDLGTFTRHNIKKRSFNYNFMKNYFDAFYFCFLLNSLTEA